MRYRKVDPRIWNDAKFVALSERGKLVFLYLLTHPNLTMLGAMRASVPGLAAELNMDAEDFREAFAEASSKGLASHDERSSFVWLPNFLKYNKPESPNVVRAWPDAFDLLPECELKWQLFERVKGFAEALTQGFGKAFNEAFAKTLPNQKQKQKQEQKQEQKTRGNGAASAAIPPPVEEACTGPEPDWPMLNCARWLLEDCAIPVSPQNQQAVAAGIGAYAKEHSLQRDAATVDLARATKVAMENGEKVDRFWFEDGKWRNRMAAKNRPAEPCPIQPTGNGDAEAHFKKRAHEKQVAGLPLADWERNLLQAGA